MPSPSSLHEVVFSSPLFLFKFYTSLIHRVSTASTAWLVACQPSHPEVTGLNLVEEASSLVAGVHCLRTLSPRGALIIMSCLRGLMHVKESSGGQNQSTGQLLCCCSWSKLSRDLNPKLLMNY